MTALCPNFYKLNDRLEQIDLLGLRITDIKNLTNYIISLENDRFGAHGLRSSFYRLKTVRIINTLIPQEKIEFLKTSNIPFDFRTLNIAVQRLYKGGEIKYFRIRMNQMIPCKPILPPRKIPEKIQGPVSSFLEQKMGIMLTADKSKGFITSALEKTIGEKELKNVEEDLGKCLDQYDVVNQTTCKLMDQDSKKRPLYVGSLIALTAPIWGGALAASFVIFLPVIIAVLLGLYVLNQKYYSI